MRNCAKQLAYSCNMEEPINHNAFTKYELKNFDMDFFYDFYPIKIEKEPNKPTPKFEVLEEKEKPKRFDKILSFIKRFI